MFDVDDDVKDVDVDGVILLIVEEGTSLNVVNCFVVTIVSVNNSWGLAACVEEKLFMLGLAVLLAVVVIAIFVVIIPDGIKGIEACVVNVAMSFKIGIATES